MSESSVYATIRTKRRNERRIYINTIRELKRLAVKYKHHSKYDFYLNSFCTCYIKYCFYWYPQERLSLMNIFCNIRALILIGDNGTSRVKILHITMKNKIEQKVNIHMYGQWK